MNQMTNLEKLPATIDPAVAAAMLVPERLNNQSLHAEAVQNAIFQRVRARLVTDGKGQPREVIENYRSVLAEDPQLRGHIRLNLLTDRVDIVGDIGWQRECSALTDTDVQYLLWYCERNYQLGNEKKLRAALAIVANENSYHPIRQALESLTWDGRSRIRDCLHHFLGAENESDSRLYLSQLWAEAMTLYKTGDYSMKFSPAVQKQLKTVQLEFMPEDTQAGQILGWLERYRGDIVCSKQLYREALGHSFDEPKRWELHNIKEIMDNAEGWEVYEGTKYYRTYGKQRGWERIGNREVGTDANSIFEE